MSNVSVIAKLTAQDGKRADLLAGLDIMMEHVETEPGTLTYIVMEDTGDENVVWFYEQYDSQASLDAHGGSDVMKALGGSIGPFMAGRPELSFCNPVRGKGL
jgi:quinol monooxygenase YgiN